MFVELVVLHLLVIIAIVKSVHVVYPDIGDVLEELVEVVTEQRFATIHFIIEFLLKNYTIIYSLTWRTSMLCNGFVNNPFSGRYDDPLRIYDAVANPVALSAMVDMEYDAA